LKTLLLSFCFIVAWSVSPQRAVAAAKPLVVLVPGFFNSLALGYSRDNSSHRQVKPYFSQNIVETIEARGYLVSIVDNLEPLGSIETNGRHLADFLTRLQAQDPQQKMILIAHSAGGLYALSAFHLQPQLPIETVVTLSTPYEGVAFLDRMSILPGIDSFQRFVNLQSLIQLREQNVRTFIENTPFPKNVRWVAMGAFEASCHIVDCYLPNRLSWVMSLTQMWIGQPSDGLVTVKSALAENLNLPIERWSDVVVPLEHWEAVQDHRLFSLLGVSHTVWVRDQQTLLFQLIIDRLQHSLNRVPTAPQGL